MTPLTTKAAEIRAGLVERLEWRDGRDATTVFSVVQVAKILGCEGLAGLDYSIIGPYRNGLYEVVLGEKIVATLGSENEAKARAQSDYEARILSALNLALIEQQAAELAEARVENERYEEMVKHEQDAAIHWCGEAAKLNERATTAESERDELLREKARLGAALAPFAKAAEDCGVEDDIRIGVVKPADVIWESAAAASITFGHLEGARSALENGPAGLADAHSKSPAPSSQSERIAVLEAARGTVLAWEALPGGNYYGIRAVQEWLNDRMAPAIGKLRAALAPLGEE